MGSTIKLYMNKEYYRVTSPGLNMQLVPLLSDESINMESSWSNVVVEPVFNTILLHAEQLIPELYNATTGITKYRKTNFNLTDSAWDEIEHGFVGNWFLISKNNTTEVVSTKDSFDENRSFVVKFMVFPSQSINDQVLQLRFGQYTLDIFRNAYCKLSLTSGGTFKADGYITGGYDRNNQKGQDLATGEIVTLYILPYRRNSILIMSSNLKGGFVYTDTDIDITTLGTITSSGAFSFKCYNKGFIQFMPATYPESGTFSISKHISHNPTGTLSVTTFDDTPDDSSIDKDESPTLTPESSSEYTQFVAETQLNASSNKYYTPFIYRVKYVWSPSVNTVADTEVEIDKWRKDSMNITLSDNPADRKLTFITDKQSCIDNLDGKCNRTIHLNKVYDDDTPSEELFVGLTDMPELTDIRAYELHCSVSDLWKKLENYRLPMNIVCDGLSHTALIADLLTLVGIPSDRVFIATDSYKLPESNRTNEAAIEFTAGTPIADIIYSISDYFTGWKVGFQPVSGKIKFVYIPIDHYDTVVKTFYLTTQNRTINDVILTEGFKISYKEPEATMIRVIGESEDGIPIIGEYIDEDAENIETAEDSRPDNWVGERRYVGIRNLALTTETDVSNAVQILAKRLTRRRKFIEFKAKYDQNVWPNYLITIDTIGTFRVKNCEININSTYYEDYDATYVAEEYVAGVN